jgi:hypothetical protein
MELHDALSQIAEIRSQLAKTEVYRGFRAIPVAISGMLALGAAGIQAIWIGDPVDRLGAYLFLWVSAAALSAIAAGVGIALRSRARSEYVRHGTWLAVEPLLPAVVAGGALAAVVVQTAPAVAWILPGIWQLLFGLGIFATQRRLPRATLAVAVFYLLSGLFCLLHARGEQALAPWAMGMPFGIGQILAAAILYWTLERGDGDA